jgi:sec-independent protein translocase protein TatB
VDVGFGEILMLTVLALLIFGPERLPGIARNVGRTIGQIRREATTTFDTLRSEVELDELQSINRDLQAEREDLRRRARGSVRATSGRDRMDDTDPAIPPRFDPHAT